MITPAVYPSLPRPPTTVYFSESLPDSTNIRRAASLALGLVTLLALLCFLLWPEWAEQSLHSRWALALFTGWCALVAACLHPELSAGFAQGLRAFRDSIDRDDDP